MLPLLWNGHQILIKGNRLSIEKLRKEYEQLYDECSILTQSGEHASAGREDAMKQEQLMQQGGKDIRYVISERALSSIIY